ncbi:hypothetical protein BOX15_Mlig010620g1, partial [Macrostomum lignano]
CSSSMADKDEISPLIANGASDISESAENSESSSTYRGANIFLLITLSVSNFFAALSFSVLSPFFPGAAEAKGISLTLTGIIIGEFELMIFLSSPFVVHIAAHVGNRFVYICGLFICGTCSVLFGVLEYCPNGSTFAIMCLLTRGIGAFGGGIFLVSSFAILAHSFPDKVSTVTGIVEMALGLGYMVGPALGGAFYDLGGFRLPFFTVGGLVLLTAVAAYLFTPALPAESGEHNRSASFLKFFSIPIALAILISYAATGAMYGMLDATMEPYLTAAFHFSSTIIGLIFLTPSLVYTLSAVLWGRLTDSMGWGIGVLIFGLIGCTIGVFFINPASFVLPIKPTLFTLLPALVLVGLGSSAVMIPVYGLCLDAAYANGMDENIATINLVSGVTNSAYSLGVFIGPTLGGRLYDTIGFDKLLFAYSGLFVVCAVLLGISRAYSRYRNVKLAESPKASADVPCPASTVDSPAAIEHSIFPRSRRSSISCLASHYSYQYTVQIIESPRANRFGAAASSA